MTRGTCRRNLLRPVEPFFDLTEMVNRTEVVDPDPSVRVASFMPSP